MAIKDFRGEDFTVGDYVVYSVLPHLKLRIDEICGRTGTPRSGIYKVIKVGETESKPSFITIHQLHLEKPSPLRYIVPSKYNRKNAYHTKSKDFWVIEDVIVSHKGHRFDSVICTPLEIVNGEIKKETFPLHDIMVVRKTHCKKEKCKTSLDIYHNGGVCQNCGWFICHKCGSHGCDEIEADNEIREQLCRLRELENPNFQSEVGSFTHMTNL
ncbi:hypothetical protein R3O67_30435 [Bacillus cereus]